MKKIKILLVAIFAVVLSACSGSGGNENTLYLMNWGDYISEDVIKKFEDEYKVTVVLSEVESNEAMYEQIKNNRTSYDIAVPSDYMIEQLQDENLLTDIDYSKLSNYDTKNLNKLVKENGPDSKNYVPYFNGTIGIMYSTKNISNIKDVIEKNGWNVLFDHTLLPNAKIGMYNSSRDAFAAALLNQNKDVNATNEKELNKAYDALKSMNYDVYGDDNLKKSVGIGNLDLALVYSGDYYDEMFAAEEDGRDLDFHFYTPKSTNYWVDGLVIPSTSKNPELAHKFLNFMLKQDNAVENASYIGYASPFVNVMDALKKDEETAYLFEDPFYDASTIKGLKPQAYHFLGLDYMVKLEEMFTQSKSK
ncbi:ABC transporter substrate-binding protein [Mycoplasma sp. P36-A1]|uniref:ABC transporter substrate-binding protein n=1 Tax=Mycoplasma sp. P36-A1 TaxID=3252900 RepID=UPI003C2FAB6E